MKRFDSKVKDLVEVRPFKGLTDFATDAEATLARYYFTDGTSALMAKWLDTAARVGDQSGAALALAGYRGVGKSHFLSVFGAILAKPELRSRIPDSHVSAGTQTLMRRRYPVLQVRRGSKPTIFEELFDAIVAEFGPDAVKPGDSPTNLLEAASVKAGDLPLIVIVDTAMDRGVRVNRDDGAHLAELAGRAKDLNVLLCVALDDDIEGADGSNAAIAGTFTIDYLDQEHLYKVVNQHVFPKAANVEPVIAEVYEFFRSVVPKFRWSAQRFSSLYPLHPGILEVAPYVRLFVHEFALLGFAADAGERILGRPANSLIAFDEVFDSVEASLRKIDDLTGAFAAYDKLNANVVGKIPVMQRLQAKLILKALLLLSLDGRGATAEDICASMLIYDESEPEKVLESVRGIIEKFSKALPEDIAVRQFGGGDLHYAFRVSSKDDLNSALQEAIAVLDPKVVRTSIRRLVQERFGDFAIAAVSPDAVPAVDCVSVWRGSQRRGHIIWADTESAEGTDPSNPDHFDWQVLVQFANNETGKTADTFPGVLWKADELRPDEVETILRFHVLQHDTSFTERFNEHVRPSLHAHRVASEKIVERILLDSGKLMIDGFDYNFSDEAKSVRTMSELFSVMLDPLFETRFPNHPVFTQRLGMTEVSRLVTDLYVGSRRSDVEVQHLAETFGIPLGLVRHDGHNYIPQPLEVLLENPAIGEIVSLVDGSPKGQVPLRDIYSALKKAPYGYVREAQHLLLAALVAERKIEFVTSRGDRINSRSLDLRIIWDDIVGIAKTLDTTASSKLLTRWAGILTGDASYKSLEKQEERDRLLTAFRDWLSDWDDSNVLNRFENMTATRLNTREWSNASRVRNTLGIVAEELRNAVRGVNRLEECLTRIGNTFADSEAEMEKSIEAMKMLGFYLDALDARERILCYLTSAELTGHQEIEAVRESLIIAVEHAVSEPSETRNREVGYLWERFRRDYSEFYASQHDEIMRSHGLQEKYNEIRRSDIWLEFIELADLPLFRGDASRTAAALCVRLDQLDCRFDLRKALGTSSSCICGFRLDESAKWHELPSELWGTVSRSLESFRAILIKRKDAVLTALESFSKQTNSAGHAEAARRLTDLLTSGGSLPRLSGTEIQVLQVVLSPTFDNGKLYTSLAGEEPERTVEDAVVFAEEADEVVVEDAVVVEI